MLVHLPRRAALGLLNAGGSKMSRSAGSIIRGMYNYCKAAGALSAESEKTMQEYFRRVSKLKPKRKKAKTSI